MKSPPRPYENLLIQRFTRLHDPQQAKASHLRLAIGDDAAIWHPRPGFLSILTCDWFLEGTHFLANRHPPDAIGWKCLARAVSDIAAMGADPRCFLLGLALPSNRTSIWLDQFLVGLRRASRTLRCPVAGGDTTRRDQILINISVVGEAKSGYAIQRSGARPGDLIFVTGHLGEAEYGLRLLQSLRGQVDCRDTLLQKHLYPQPRLQIGQWLAANKLATSMMDLSDGLSADLPRLCAASHVGAILAENNLPLVQISAAHSARFDPIKLALHGGDDYELLFTVRPKNLRRIPKKIAGVALTQIGEITAGNKLSITTAAGNTRRLSNQGWDPFR